MKKERFLKVSELTNLHLICVDFSRFLMEKEKVEKEIANNPNFQSGVNFGIRSALILLNDFIITNNGMVDKDQLEKIFIKVSKKST